MEVGKDIRPPGEKNSDATTLGINGTPVKSNLARRPSVNSHQNSSLDKLALGTPYLGAPIQNNGIFFQGNGGKNGVCHPGLYNGESSSHNVPRPAEGWHQYLMGNYSTTTMSNFNPFVFTSDAANALQYSHPHFMLLNGKMQLDPQFFSDTTQLPRSPSENGFGFLHPPNYSIHHHLHQITQRKVESSIILDQLSPITPHKSDKMGNCRMNKGSIQNGDTANIGGNKPVETYLGKEALYPEDRSSMGHRNHDQGSNSQYIYMNKFISSTFEPVTPDKYKAMWDFQSLRTSVIEENTKTDGNKENQTDNGHAYSKHIETHDNFSEQSDLLSITTRLSSEQQILIQTKNQEIELTNTPAQKPRRKRHRPKVVVEGKSARQSKQRTPESVTASENATGKRKYTRRNKEPSLDTPSSELREITGPTKKRGRRSTKRALNFDSEDQKKYEYEFQSCDSCPINPDINIDHNISSNISNIISVLDIPVAIENAVDPLAKIMTDLDHSVNHGSSNIHNRLQEDQTSTPQSSIGHGHIPSDEFKGIANQGNRVQSRSGHPVPSKSQEAKQSTLERRKNKCYDVDHHSFIHLPELFHVNVLLGNFDPRISHNKLGHLPEICKRRRTDNRHNKFLSIKSDSKAPEHHNNPCELFSFEDTQRIKAHERQQAVHFTIQQKHQKRTQTSKETVQDDKLISRIAGAVWCQSPSMQRSSQVYDQTSEFTKMGDLTEYVSLKVPRRRRTKLNNVESAPLKVPRKRRTKKLNKADPVEIIIHSMKRLDINRVSTTHSLQKELALIPYSGAGAMVPFLDQLDSLRKRRPRAKVELDSETNRVWMLLMGNECGNCPEGTIDKEKWWEEERRVFQGRADSFVARMHLIQGDRRFSKWKGSVVDSVVGVFLTQNVSDHLSSSAFMALAARFPCQPRSKSSESNAVDMIASKASQKLSILEFNDKEDKNILNENKFQKVAALFQRDQHINGKESAEENESLEKDVGPYSNPYSKWKNVDERETRINSPKERNHTSSEQTGSISFFQTDDMISAETPLSSQNSGTSSHNSTNFSVNMTEQTGMVLESNSIIDDNAPDSEQNNLEASTSFLKLLQMAETSKLQELYSWNDEPFGSNVIKVTKSEKIYKTNLRSEQQCKLKGASPLKANCDSFTSGEQHDFAQTIFPFSANQSCQNNGYRYEKLDSVSVDRENKVTSLSSLSEEKWMQVNRNGPTANNKTEAVRKRDLASATCSTAGCDPFTDIRDEPIQTLPNSRAEACLPACFLPVESMVSSVESDISNNNPDFHNAELQRNDSELDLLEKRQTSLNVLYQKKETKVHESESESIIYARTSIVQELTNSVEREGVSEVPSESNGKDIAHTETPQSAIKTKRKRVVNKRNDDIDWDILRKEVLGSDLKKERNRDTMDSVDWEAVRCADVSEISNAIRERGMNNMLAERIKAFLNRLVRDHGSIDLEWLREVPPEKVKDYLLSVRGLGLKSVECVRLLTLHHLAFPVDTNVGRICVRLGWVPLQPLPESLQLHLLELYPVLETIQKYLWPRLCKLDQRTLYELHYQMITFGKVFCTKSKPNCNACPMRGECRHFASAFASARLALPGPQEKSLVSSVASVASEQNFMLVTNHKSLPLIEEVPLSQGPALCVPIIEEPATPEPECVELLENAIEDAFYEDPDEIPEIKLNIKQFTQNLQNIMQENNMELQGGDLSKALIALNPEAASIPQPKLKNISRLRTEHFVYELPDSHPLLEGLDQREPDDPCPYLLAIWTPGETAQSTSLPEIMCSSQGTGNLCGNKECFACNSIREVQAQKVRGTLLIPCRTAMRGSFPLNGTYFQVNEVFADHCSSLSPIDVPREWIWNLPRRTVYFGTSVPTIFKGLTTEGIQQCFWRGFVCVRGFDQKTRAPRPLLARLHFPASKAPRKRRTSKKEED